MTQELFRESGGKIPEDSDLKSSFNWDSNYREHMCRNDIKISIHFFDAPQDRIEGFYTLDR